MFSGPCGKLRDGPRVRRNQPRASPPRTREARSFLPAEAGWHPNHPRPPPADDSEQIPFRLGAAIERLRPSMDLVNRDAEILPGFIKQVTVCHNAIFDLWLPAGSDKIITNADLPNSESPKPGSNANPE